MTSRAEEIAAFLAPTPFADWTQNALAADASARRYIRLTKGALSMILMDAPPPSNESTQPFARIAQLLTSQHLCAPHVIAHDPERGLMLLTDLGDEHFADWLATHPSDAHELYRAATEILLKLEEITPPNDLPRMTPAIGAQMIAILNPHYMSSDIAELCATMEAALAQCAPDPTVLALRDYHAENLIWRPAHQGSDRVGLLDFQDAFVAPAGYDLASLLRDARRDVPAPLVQEMITYFAEVSKAEGDLHRAIACLGVQRNLRILGVFARLVKEMKKPKYLAFFPRLWGHILRDLEHPALKDLKTVVVATVPPPTQQHLRALSS